MSNRRLSLAIIAAVAANGVIGRDGKLPWFLPEDLQHFKSMTYNSRIIMGRRTWESLAKPLGFREHVVVTSSQLVVPEGVHVARSLAEALQLPGQRPVFVIGGAALYREALPLVDVMFLTEIAAQVNGDTLFPDWDRSLFRELSRVNCHAPPHQDGSNTLAEFVHYERI